MEDAVLNARGWKCPLPVLRASKLIALASAGETLRVEATDRDSVEDFLTWSAKESTVELLSQSQIADPDGRAIFVHVIRRR